MEHSLETKDKVYILVSLSRVFPNVLVGFAASLANILGAKFRSWTGRARPLLFQGDRRPKNLCGVANAWRLNMAAHGKVDRSSSRQKGGLHGLTSFLPSVRLPFTKVFARTTKHFISSFHQTFTSFRILQTSSSFVRDCIFFCIIFPKTCLTSRSPLLDVIGT